MVAVETVGQLTLEVPRPSNSWGAGYLKLDEQTKSSREQLEDPVSTGYLLLSNIGCAVCAYVSWKHTSAYAKAGTSEVWCVCFEKIQVRRCKPGYFQHGHDFVSSMWAEV